MYKLQVMLLGIVLLSTFVNAEEIVLILSPFDGNINPEYGTPYKAWFEAPNVIIVYNYLSYDQELYRQFVMHELQHYYCYHLFGDADMEHKRCF